MEDGRMAKATGLSPSGSSQQAVSPVPASIPCAGATLIRTEDGYSVYLGDKYIGRMVRHYPEWERRTKGRRYVNARGTCKRPVWRAYAPIEGRGWNYRTRAEAVAGLISDSDRNPKGGDSEAAPGEA